MRITISNPAFGQNLLTLRKRYCLSRRGMGKLLGINIYTLKKWEEGTLPPESDETFLARLAAVFPNEAGAILHGTVLPE